MTKEWQSQKSEQHTQIILLEKNQEREFHSLICSVMSFNLISLSMTQNSEWKMPTELAISFLVLVTAKMKFSTLSDILIPSLISLMMKIWNQVQSVLNPNHATGIQELILLFITEWTGTALLILKDLDKRSKNIGEKLLQKSSFLISSPRLALVMSIMQSMT